MTEHLAPTPDRPVEADGAYNGWANYPTWSVHLWLSNRKALHELATAQVSDAGDPVAAASNLRDWIESNNLLQTASLWNDLLGWALREVDWSAVAAAFAPEGGNGV